MCLLTRRSSALLLAVSLSFLPSLLTAQDAVDHSGSSYRHHDDPQWLIVQEHLPDPATASAKLLEVQADLLRVRKFPEDALDYYGFAIHHGGTSAALMNKIGLTELEMRNIVLAQGYFRQAIKLDRRNPQGWNNLAATEYLERQFGTSVSDYKHAVKLDKTNAVYHANLGTAYFEMKNFKKARVETNEALRLDPLMYQHSSGSGVSAHVLSVEDRARFAFEMARLYAQHGQEEEMLHSLAVSSENGFDIIANMMKDPVLSKYGTDPRVELLVTTAKMLHEGNTPIIANNAALKKDAVLQPSDRTPR